jgi:uncharacterized protein YecT (DUF1311 family)
MNDATLTRGQALDAIENALTTRLPREELLDLQQMWIGHRDFSGESAETLAEFLREYVAECCVTDETRSNGNADSDDTGIPA